MDRNTNSHFSYVPERYLKRSKFNIPFGHKTSFNMGYIIPLFTYLDVLPYETYEMFMASVIRLETPQFPIMDNLFLDIYWFYVPNRILQEHWKEILGENRTGAWYTPTEYSVAQIHIGESGVQENSILDYMGVPTKIENFDVSALGVRAYNFIYDEFFRDQNLIEPVTIPTNDTTVQYNKNSPMAGGMCRKAAKVHDYFTSALPEPQKGPSIQIPIGESAPVVGNGALGLTNGTNEYNLAGHYGTWSTYTNTGIFGSDGGSLGDTATRVNAEGVAGVSADPEKSGLKADLTNAVASDINDLRLQIAMQQFYETDARYGTRYREIMRAHFGVTPEDAIVQIPQYIGGKRIPIVIEQVTQNSAATVDSPIGQTGAMSLTVDADKCFTKSFVEHGVLLCLGVVRQIHTYQQGLSRQFSRKTKFDYYWPEFAYLGEQPIYNKELCLTGTDRDDEIFGYQERNADYRYMPSIVTGQMRSNAQLSLDEWHLADDYDLENPPVLGQDFIEETDEYLKRTLAVQDESISNEFWADFYFEFNKIAPMPIYPTPGLLRV